MAEEKAGAADVFRSALEDLLTIAEALASHCQSMDEVNSVVRLALTNDGQLSLLMQVVNQKNKAGGRI